MLNNFVEKMKMIISILSLLVLTASEVYKCTVASALARSPDGVLFARCTKSVGSGIQSALILDQA